MPKADKAARPLLASFAIAVNGTPLSRVVAAHVTSVVVDEDVALPGMFSFDLVGSDDRRAPASWVDSDLFAIGASVEIKLGYDERVTTLLTGEITALEPEFGVDHLPNLTVRGFDRLHRLQRGRRTRTFAQHKDSDAAGTIASQAGLSADTTDSGVTHDYLIQANQTDFEFLSARAAAIGYELRVSDRTVLFRPRRPTAGAKVTLSPQTDLLEFQPRMTAAQQVSDVSLRSWSVKDKKVVTSQARASEGVSAMGKGRTGPATAQSAFGSAAEPIIASSPLSAAEGDRFATARLTDAALAFISGDGLCWGHADVRAGSVIAIADIGTRFSGPYYVTRTRHRYSSHDGYTTEFGVQRNAS